MYFQGGKTINIFFEIHKDLPREGPGDNLSTKKAFSMLTLPKMPKILDIGCGPGMQTIEISKLTDGKITALDNHQPFLDELNHRALKEGLSEKIETVNGSMFSLDFKEENFDLIWSEGAIYIMGFEKGLNYWKTFLKEKGYIAVTELSWIKSDPPEEPVRFWKENYAGMKTIDENLKIIKELGFSETEKFILPQEGWRNYYDPVKERVSQLREKYEGNEEIQKILGNEMYEIYMYETYHDFYGYVFYIMRKDK